MNYLIGDIGNTYIKLSVLNDNLSIKKIYNIKTIDIIKERQTISSIANSFNLDFFD